MKTRIYLLLVAISISFSSMAQSLVEKANAEYVADKYANALQLYLQAASVEGVSSDLYYNIGNTYYRMGELGHAVLYFERAVMLDPQNDDAKTNLEFVNSKIQTKIAQEKSFVIQVIDDFVGSLSSNTWATLAAISFILLLSGILLYVFSSVIALRKIGFFGGGVMLLSTIITLLCAISMKSKVEAHNKAIVITPSVTLSTVPRTPKDKNEEAFILTAGNKVTIVDSVETKNDEEKIKWYDVKADDTHRAWLKSDNIEII